MKGEMQRIVHGELDEDQKVGSCWGRGARQGREERDGGGYSEETLLKVVEHKFPRAGSRLAYRNGADEFQIPETFDAQTPPFTFTVEDHPEVAMFRCSMVNDDLTFIEITFPHLLFDALGASALLSAWTRLLAGEDMHTVPGMKWDARPLKHFGSSTSLKPAVPRGRFTLRQPPARACAKVFINEAKQTIMDELKAQGSNEYGGSSDVFAAFWLKTVYDLRSLPIFAHDAPLATPYIHNAVSSIPFPPIPANVIQTESIGELALRIRHLLWQCAETNFLKTLSPCPPSSEYWILTNLRSARFAELDFSGAAAGNSMGTALRVVFTYPEVTFSFPPLGRGATMVTMEDEDAVWMCDTRGAKEWERIRQTGIIAFTD
ncbi:hypothetical protein K438DRAFT_1938426 [Mycena galopus ATCC 62051]|nr:hypothetical protein K438DRAFT_1938426 [Mycena galopus ATCC 62051]